MFLKDCPRDLQLLAIGAANWRLLKSSSKAAKLYESALQHSRRPELFFNAGMTQFESGDRESARKYLIASVEFDPTLLTSIVPLELRGEVLDALTKEKIAVQNLLANPKFSRVGPRGRRTQFTGRGDGGPAAADDFQIRNATQGTVVTELTDVGGQKALRVLTTGGQYNGIRQGIPPHVLVGRATLRVAILVKRGQIAIGAGERGVNLDQIITASGEWRTVYAESKTCPVRVFNISSVTDYAEFYVSHVELMPMPWIRCDVATSRPSE